jgi:uncharacterized heparinase superfamily protein
LERPAQDDRSLTRLEPSGYVRLDRGGAVALLDLAPVGPDYLPGHAHADTLSFELSLHGERVVVNGGTSVYAEGPERSRERGTAAHSTVEIDGQDSSEVWAAFRVGRRAQVFDARVSDADGELRASAAHDGYRHRTGSPIHRRSWGLTEGRLVVEDSVEGSAGRALARFHLPPTLQASISDDGFSGALRTDSGREIRWTASAPARLEPSTWSPEFGRRTPTCAIVAPVGSGGLRTEFRW